MSGLKRFFKEYYADKWNQGFTWGIVLNTIVTILMSLLFGTCN